MDVFRLFRALIIASFALVLLTLVAAYATPDLPEEVTAYLDGDGAGPLYSQLTNGSTATQIAFGAGLIAFLGAWVASMVGMLGFKRWSRITFIVITVLGYLLLPLEGATVAGPIEGTIGSLLCTCDGALLALLFTDPVRSRFAAQVAV